MNKYDYKNKVAIVTGASSGIGEVYARKLAAKGSHVVLVARSKNKLDVLAKEIHRQYGIQAYALACDLSQADAPRQLEEQIAELGLSVDVLINNAGFATYGRFEEADPQREQEEIMLNTAALVDLTHRFLPEMLKRGPVSGGYRDGVLRCRRRSQDVRRPKTLDPGKGGPGGFSRNR